MDVVNPVSRATCMKEFQLCVSEFQICTKRHFNLVYPMAMAEPSMTWCREYLEFDGWLTLVYSPELDSETVTTRT
jgi:hypothetical protein